MKHVVIETIMVGNNEPPVRGHIMREVPKTVIPDEALDKPKCRDAVKTALAHPEPEKAFDRQGWLVKTKAQLKRHASASR